MSAAVWTLAATFIPSLLAVLLLVPRWRGAITPLTPFASWPMLAAALAAIGQPPAEVPALLLGVRVGVDAFALLLLLAGVLVWTLAGLRLARQPPLVLAAALAAQTGSLGALIALDAAGFYLFFSLMTVASYGLVIADRSAAAHAAGRIYLALALGGELVALAAFITATAGAPGLVSALLLLFGLGAKLGLPPLHVALPIAYRAAPAPGGAVIGSVLVNAAIAGLVRFLPETAGDPQPLGMFLILFGIATAFLGALLGMMQHDPKALLGYSTVSQMGILTAVVGIAAGLPNGIAAGVPDGFAAGVPNRITAGVPDGFAVLAPAIALFALHHALVKAALFLGLERAPGRGRTAVLIALSLALAAAPFTGGALAKLWIEAQAYGLPRAQFDLLHLLLPLTSTGTALLMARFVVLAAPVGSVASPPLPFSACAGLALGLPWVTAAALHPAPFALAASPGHVWLGAWPLLLAAIGVMAAGWAGRRGWRMPAVPPGDVLTALWPMVVRLHALLRAFPERLPKPGFGWAGALWHRLDPDWVERRLRGFRLLGFSYLLLLAVLLALAIPG